jgi:hypothetical protein
VKTAGEQPRRLGGITGAGFRPGQCGNPKGRPPGLPPDLAKQCRHLTPQLVERLITLTAHRDPRVALQAIVYLLDRGWGKPRQAVDVEGPAMIPASVLEDGARRLAERLARLESAVAGDGRALSHAPEAARPASGDQDGGSSDPQAARKDAYVTLQEKLNRLTDGRVP